MDLGFSFDNSYGRLPERFYTRQPPVAVRTPSLLALNHGLAAELGLDTTALQSPDGVAMLAGNSVPTLVAMVKWREARLWFTLE